MPTPLPIRLRRLVARRPWIHWAAVAAFALAAAGVVYRAAADVEATRRTWGTTRPVLVADGDHAPGDPIDAVRVDLPVAMIPAAALDDVPPDARARQRITDGEPVVAADVTAPDGPAAGAGTGTLVVGVVDPLAPGARPGLGVVVVAEGLVLAPHASVVSVVGDVVYVAVGVDDAAVVAAAARSGTASLVFVP